MDVPGQYLEDLSVGQVYGSGTLTVSKEDIQTFAGQFDAQPFHLDEGAAEDSLFGELVASGWHTAALTMKLLVAGEYRPVGGIVGGRADSLQWPTPTKPGDVLSCKTEILELKPSSTRPGIGSVKLRTTTVNGAGKPVFILVINGIVRRRPTVT